MRVKPITILPFLLAVFIVVPVISGCEMIASYLIYEWIQDEFGDNKDSEDPVIRRIYADREKIYVGEQVVLTVEAVDNKDKAADLSYFWFASAGTMSSPTSRITIWTAPSTKGTVTISIIVTDTDGNKDSASVEIEVLE